MNIKLKLKKKYINVNVDSPKFGKLNLSDINENDYEYYNNNGFSEFFTRVKPKRIEKDINITMDIKKEE